MKFLLALIFSFTSNFAYGQDLYSFKIYLKDQTVKVYQDDQLIKEFPCSTGIKAGSTPSGSFKTYFKKEKDTWVEDDGTEINYYYSIKFNKNIAFHSQIEGDHPLVKEGEKLFLDRKPSSMGCVRLEKEDAKWIYDLPLGMDVEVIDGNSTDSP